MLNRFVLFLGKGHYLFTHPSWLASRRSGTPTKMLEESLLKLEILSGELDVERILITKHREEEIINHIFQSNGELTNKNENRMQRGRLTAHQMSKTLGTPEAFQVIGNRH